MHLLNEISDFFNEARPRTKSAGIEDIERPGSGQAQRDPDLYGDDRKKPEKSYILNVNPEGEKSSFKAGSVHEIRFNNITPGINRSVYTIYRGLSEQDYNTLRTSSSKVATLITPSTEPEHESDVYYITIPKLKYGERKGVDYTYFVYLEKERVDKLTQEQKDKIKLKLVPIKDIADGLSKRPLTYNTLKDFLSDKNKKRLKVQTPSSKSKPSAKSSGDEDTLDFDLGFLIDDEDADSVDSEQPKEDSPEVKSAKQKAAEFMLDDKVERTFIQLIKNYDISETPATPEQDKKEAKEKVSEMLKRFLDALFSDTSSELEREAVINYNVSKKLEKKPGLFKKLKQEYEKMELLKESLNEGTNIKDESIYDASVKYDGGKSKDAKINGKSLKKLIGSEELVYNKDIPFERVVDDPKRGMVTIKGTVKIAAPVGGSLKLIGRRTPEGEPIMYDPAAKKTDDKKDEPASRTLKTSISGQGVRSYKVPVNMGIKMVDVKPSQLAYKYYIISTEDKNLVHGTNDWAEAKQKASELGDKFKAVT